MKEFTIEELAEWIDERFTYELQPGEITAAEYSRIMGMDHNTAAARLNKMAKLGLMTSKREVVNGKNMRVFMKVNDVEFEAID